MAVSYFENDLVVVASWMGLFLMYGDEKKWGGDWHFLEIHLTMGPLDPWVMPSCLQVEPEIHSYH